VVRAADNGLPPLSATAAVTVVVREVNQAPVLAPISSRTINEGYTLLISSVATDLDLPPNNCASTSVQPPRLAPALDATNGLLSWRPTETQGPSTTPSGLYD